MERHSKWICTCKGKFKKSDGKPRYLFGFRTKAAVIGVRGTEFTVETATDTQKTQMHTLAGEVVVAKDQQQFDAGKGVSVPMNSFITADLVTGLSAPQAFDPKSYLQELKEKQPDLKSGHADTSDHNTDKKDDSGVKTIYAGLQGSWGAGLNFPLGTSFLSGFGGGANAGIRLLGPLGVGAQFHYSSLSDIASSVIAIPSNLTELYGKVFIQSDNGLGLGFLVGQARYQGTGIFQSVDVTKFAAGLSIFRDYVIVSHFTLGAGVEFKGIFPGAGAIPYIFADMAIAAKLWF